MDGSQLQENAHRSQLSTTERISWGVSITMPIKRWHNCVLGGLSLTTSKTTSLSGKIFNTILKRAFKVGNHTLPAHLMIRFTLSVVVSCLIERDRSENAPTKSLFTTPLKNDIIYWKLKESMSFQEKTIMLLFSGSPWSFMVASSRTVSSLMKCSTLTWNIMIGVEFISSRILIHLSRDLAALLCWPENNLNYLGRRWPDL